MAALNLKANPEFEVYGNGADLVVEIALTIHASPMGVSERAPISLTAVLDRSGSMAGSKIHMVLETSKFMIRQTSSCDRLSIVTYDTEVEELCPLHLMNPSAKGNVQMLLRGVQTGSCTNLSGGLLKGLDHQQVLEIEEGDAEPVRSLILFTDGLANVGITDKGELLQCVSSALDNRHRVQIHTVGFGKDHDAELLQKIAGAGNGNYYFIESPDEIPTAFADVLGGISSVTAQNVELHISPSSPDIVVQKVLSGFGCKDKEGGSKSVSFGDMYAEERKDVLVRVKIPAREVDVEKESLISVNLSYFSVKEAKVNKEPRVITVKRAAEVPPGLTPAPVVVDQRCRFSVIEAMQQATEAADKGMLQEAQKILGGTRTYLQDHEGSSTQAKYALAELNNMSGCLGNREDYATVGSKKMRNVTRSHQQQRASSYYRTTGQLAAVTSYNTSVVGAHQNNPQSTQLPAPSTDLTNTGPVQNNSGGRSAWLGFMNTFSRSGRQRQPPPRSDRQGPTDEVNRDASHQGTKGSYTGRME